MLNTILIVDGDVVQLQIMQQIISEKLKYKTITTSSAQEAINLVISDNSSISLMLLDMRQEESLHVIQFIKYNKPNFPILILTEYGGHDSAVEAVHAGANDFLVKPVATSRLRLSIASALRIRHLCKVVEELEKRLGINNTNFMQQPINSISSPSSLSDNGRVKKLRALEEDAILFALNACGGSMSKASRSLGIGRSTLYRKVSEMERHKVKTNYISRENHTTRPITVTSEMEHS